MAYTKTVWVNNQAPAINAENLNKIEDGIYNSVRYADAQTLTDAQKTQARGNINAAPGGFGLGASSQAINIDWNEALSNGWWRDGDDNLLNRPFPGRWGIGLTTNYTEGSHLVQSAFWVDSDGSVYQKIRGRYQGGTWGAWEWVNPPMQLGVEYRTTERYQGKPVYVKVVDCGNMPNNSKKMVCAEIGPGVVDKYVYFSAENYLNAYDMTVLPVNGLGTYYANARIVMGRNPSSELYEPYIELFSSNVWPSSYTCRATIKYTKIAD